jgi:hypothetical protein
LPYDLETSRGIKIEVKASAYMQSWAHDRPSKLVFGIAPARGWNPETNTVDPEPRRQADVYVFCVLTPTTRDAANPLDVRRWAFHVLPTRVLDARCPGQKTIGLGSLRRLGAVEASFKGLAEAIRRAAASEGT